MIDWLKETLLASGLLIGLVLVTRQPVRLWAGPKLAYALWLLPAVRILMPPLPVAEVTVPDLFSAIHSQAEAIGPLQAPGTDWRAPLAIVWLGGALAFLLYHLLRHRRFVQGLLAATTGAERQIGTVRVWTSLAAQGPLAVGLLARQVVLPADFHSRFGETERELVLAHELMHHRRGDLISNMAALVLLSLHWFNPIAHIAFRCFRDDQELACDADVIAAKGVTSRYDYGRALAKAACQPDIWSLCSLRPAAILKMRLKSLAQRRGEGQGRMASVAVFTVFAGVLLVVSPRMPSASGPELALGPEKVSVSHPRGRPISPPAARLSDGSAPQRSSTASRTAASGENNASEGMDSVHRAAFERSVEAAAMRDAAALEAIVQARHMKLGRSSPT